MKRSLSLIMALLMVMSTFALWTITASAEAVIVQDGLVSWFDGNDYEGTTWTDKKGDNDITDCVDGTFENGAYVLDQAQQALPNELYDVLRGEEFTIELNLGEFENYPDTGYTTWLCNNSGTNAEKLSIYIQLNKGAMDTFKAKTSGIASTARPAFNDATATLQDATLAVTFKAGEKTNVYVNGVLMASATSPATNANASVGQSPKLILGNAGVNNCSNTAFEGLRFYDRALTADEVKNNADVDNGAAQPVEPEEIPFIMYGTGLENWSDNTQLLLQANMPETLIGDTVTPWDITFTWDGGSKTITQCSTSHYRWKKDEPKTIQRFTIVIADQANQFIPEVGVEYTVTATVTKEGKTYNFSGDAPFVMNVEPIVPDEYNYGDQPVNPPVEPPVEEGPKSIEASAYGNGWENWSEQTQLLIVVPFDSKEVGATEYTWKITLGDKTIELVPSSVYDYGDGSAIWRFETCLAEGENQFVPVAGESYVISAEVYSGDELVYEVTAKEGASWNVPADFQPILPDPVDPPQTGDATVYAMVFAVVAIMGMAVVVTKKVNA